MGTAYLGLLPLTNIAIPSIVWEETAYLPEQLQATASPSPLAVAAAFSLAIQPIVYAT